MTDAAKTCSKCGKSKVADSFSPAKNMKDGLSSWCKECRKNLEAERRAAKGITPKKRPFVGEGEKQCLDCMAIKPIDQFSPTERGRLGRSAYCKKCSRERSFGSNLDSKRKATQRYRDSNRERWRATHRERMRERREAERKADTGLVSKEFLDDLYATETCHYCGRPTKPEDRTKDHAIPLSRGGEHAPSNLVMACLHCNTSKKDMTPKEFADAKSRSRVQLPL